jgi:hypothetical protein
MNLEALLHMKIIWNGTLTSNRQFFIVGEEMSLKRNIMLLHKS